MAKLNENSFERKLGIFFMIIWILVLVFYSTWDGWIYEWRECGYAGLNQHFDLDFLDMVWSVVDGQIVYQTTNNLHNIIYLCFLTFMLGWIGLLTGNEYFRQGAMATLAFPVISLLSTLNPITDHLYIVQIVYDIVHISGISIGVYFFYKEDLNMKKATPYILFTWVVYFITRILMTKSPFWENDGLAYFSGNQINDMPFYLYGFEFGVVVLIFLVINYLFMKVNEKFPKRWMKAVFPLAIFIILCIVFLATGLIQLQSLDMGTCPIN